MSKLKVMQIIEYFKIILIKLFQEQFYSLKLVSTKNQHVIYIYGHAHNTCRQWFLLVKTSLDN